jgi:hypothetical protein
LLRENGEGDVAGVHGCDAPGADVFEGFKSAGRAAVCYARGDYFGFEGGGDGVFFEGDEAVGEVIGSWWGGGGVCDECEGEKWGEMRDTHGG